MTTDHSSTNERRSEGSAGIPREVSQRDQVPSGADCAGRENEEMAWAQRHVPEEPQPVSGSPVPRPTRSVFRKTELYGEISAITPVEQRKLRHRTMDCLKGSGATVSYQPFEQAFRDFTCSLIEHQYVIEQEMLVRIADLQQQIDVLERRQEQLRQAPAGNAEVQP